MNICFIILARDNRYKDPSQVLEYFTLLIKCFQYVHYEIEYPAENRLKKDLSIAKKLDTVGSDVQMFHPQVRL